ncbi:hypothetical protein G7K_0423-t1 [Saitoella complicata NRRL Y-17804]|uniref:Uncharacterized protein n=1 Tax=Saitoella complicata (strain BCRC 22490 / CBS 7301 / JCM 7358 / NBRC 10748 / NRRL Y-17804) TaxID=698492 RepID=A0A0E9N8Z7_SAICN|nr:hypothetical protein G7K_0423-t1 [Saitoella complicata NRRL Y-17804]
MTAMESDTDSLDGALLLKAVTLTSILPSTISRPLTLLTTNAIHHLLSFSFLEAINLVLLLGGTHVLVGAHTSNVSAMLFYAFAPYERIPMPGRDVGRGMVSPWLHSVSWLLNIRAWTGFTLLNPWGTIIISLTRGLRKPFTRDGMNEVEWVTIGLVCVYALFMAWSASVWWAAVWKDSFMWLEPWEALNDVARKEMCFGRVLLEQVLDRCLSKDFSKLLSPKHAEA